MKLALALAAAVALLAGCGDGRTQRVADAIDTAESASPATPEEAYLAKLNAQHIRYASDDAAIDYAHEACQARDAGATPYQLTDQLAAEGGYSREDAAAIVVAVLGTVCRK